MRPPVRPDDDPRNTQVFLRRTLLEQGYDDYAISRMVKDCVLARVRRGAYADWAAGKVLPAAGRHGLVARAVVQQAKTPVVLSHVSAALEYDVPDWGLDLDDVHVTRLDGRLGRHEAGVHQHCGKVLAGDVVRMNGVDVMSATRAALEVTTVAGVEASLAVVNHLLHAGHTTLRQLAERYAVMDHWPNTLHTDVVLRLADPRIESLGETRTYHLCFRHSLPMPEPQYEIKDERGVVVARVDFAWPSLGVFLEFDGKVKYEKLLAPGESASPVVIREKRREDEIRRLTGWRCIRLTWADLAQPDRTATMIRAALERAAA
ncbi:type IV toxin-antitoxin system AbiEi family antitoxin domain-containing protein [Nocardioides sp. URHA0020]|uniref:type IV toxin-antitoxin system AbiEi family antitoxin domain-containing protein n=1 Tax=Nocardioides sp. URHA0020 TaxID=1380392 RepID=UPI0012DFD865|nr:type IV toxin-antitoxin system AbiEi family antitoxin domain-containing protein [Nocardioides sp. URHA0020]